MDAAQQRHFESMAAHHVLTEMCDSAGQRPQDQMQALMNAARRARSGQDDGPSYLAMAF
jgi:hypothetical protein